MVMGSRYNKDYVERHQKIVNKLVDLVEEEDCACLPVSKLAAEVGMDQRTVRTHLKILEIHYAGVFVDGDDREFCTREGVASLAKRLRLSEVADGSIEK
jgi:DNA-binding transcriptional ArsR family regulator